MEPTLRYPLQLPSSFSWEDEAGIVRQGEGTLERSVRREHSWMLPCFHPRQDLVELREHIRTAFRPAKILMKINVRRVRWKEFILERGIN
jgi:hypothetical protein